VAKSKRKPARGWRKFKSQDNGEDWYLPAGEITVELFRDGNMGVFARTSMVNSKVQAEDIALGWAREMVRVLEAKIAERSEG
jgi:hypothetical protein